MGSISFKTTRLAAATALLTVAIGGSAFAQSTTNTTIEIGGYVKTDFIFDVDEALGDAFDVGSISIGAADDTERFRAHARQSRLFFKTSTDTSSGPVKTHVEFDFFGGGGNQIFSNSSSPRLRHAYGSWNGWTVGQTWTNFMPIESYPSTTDFNGPSGIPFVRQAQIRYTFPSTGNLAFSVSLENSEFSGRDAAGPVGETSGDGIRAGIDQVPDFTAAAAWTGNNAFVKLAGVVREFNAPGETDSATGWGVNLSGNTSIWQGGMLYGSVTHGDGVGRYILDGAGQDAFVDGAGQLQTIEATGVTLAVSQELGPQLKAGLAYGYYEVNDTFAATDTDNQTTIHASLFYKPVDRITIAGEIIYGEREIVSGASDDAVRFHTSFQFNF